MIYILIMIAAIAGLTISDDVADKIWDKMGV